MRPVRLLGPLGWIVVLSVPAYAIPLQHDHPHDSQAGHQHHAQVKQRGGEAMGFDQDKTTHHFRLTPQGGVIEVQANTADDVASRDHIRQHLQEISRKFKEGDFSAPKHTHGRVPPGVQLMKARKANIDYHYEERQRGGQVVISTKDPAALKAVHSFLRFQIEDHRTGDSTTVQ